MSLHGASGDIRVYTRKSDRTLARLCIIHYERLRVVHSFSWLKMLRLLASCSTWCYELCINVGGSPKADSGASGRDVAAEHEGHGSTELVYHVNFSAQPLVHNVIMECWTWLLQCTHDSKHCSKLEQF